MRRVAGSDWKRGAAVAAIALFARGMPASAQALVYRFDIPAQELGAALKTFARVSHQQLGFDIRSVRGKRAPALSGQFTPGVALARLLAGSGLVAQSGKSGVILIRPVSAPVVSGDTGSSDVAATTEPDVVVTGTHIRNGAIAAPVLRISNQQMREAGQRDLGEVIRDIPSNYTGGQNPGARFQAGTAANTNASGSSALNLRGLGPDATLTLLNGRRLPYDGSAQAIDVSAIPIDAVREIQIVPDGASALYGSDAVAGVANVVLRSDYEGIATTARIGTATDGGGFINAYDAVGGKHWGGGGALLALQFDHQNAVRSDQRDYTRYVVSPNTLLDAHKHFSALGTAHQDITDTLTFSIERL
ncbi:hypothetical protein EWE75_23350 [Sphingomonas populi]|uniref:Secretin/TonB short N-terminal domain-containing protein n=1 Tax=Sphingomonas populi TaxID=2484750 RepID=A0A4Q6XIR1_9SPHN|nr:STN domain-containing protein [Sphingomonas populi]RZF59145.1 hypothetical protein EWE75_23350 [Sphingomonas populi]